MDWRTLIKKAGMTGIVCSLVYHMTLFVTGQPVSFMKVLLFTILFIALYAVWLMMTEIGRKK